MKTTDRFLLLLFSVQESFAEFHWIVSATFADVHVLFFCFFLNNLFSELLTL